MMNKMNTKFHKILCNSLKEILVHNGKIHQVPFSEDTATIEKKIRKLTGVLLSGKHVLS